METICTKHVLGIKRVPLRFRGAPWVEDGPLPPEINRYPLRPIQQNSLSFPRKRRQLISGSSRGQTVYRHRSTLRDKGGEGGFPINGRGLSARSGCALPVKRRVDRPTLSSYELSLIKGAAVFEHVIRGNGKLVCDNTFGFGRAVFGFEFSIVFLDDG